MVFRFILLSFSSRMGIFITIAMNIPEIYLVEPYNAYAPKGKKKHWMQEVEEQALMAKIIAEQQALREATSPTLPKQAPPISVMTAQHYSGGEGAVGQANSNGGGGQTPRPQFFTPNMAISFTASPITASAPSTIQFTVAGDPGTLQLGAVAITWNFGDGTIISGVSPSHTYNTVGNFLVQMTASAVHNPSNVTTQSLYVTMSAPTVSAAFTVSDLTSPITFTNGYYTASHGDVLQFTDASSNSVNWNWMFSSGSANTSSISGVEDPTFTYSSASIYAITQGVTGSFGNKASGVRNICIV
jgi:PKD repeat protein